MRLKLRVKVILFLAMILMLIMFILIAKIDNKDNLKSVFTTKTETKTEAQINNNSKEKNVSETKTENSNNAESDVDDKFVTLTDDELKELYKTFDDTLFIGDSRTEGIKIYSGITNADFFCEKSLDVQRILSGETVNFGGEERKLSEVLKNKSYSKVYVCLGINELGWDEEDEFIEKYQQIIDDIKETQSSAKIYVELIFPINEEKTKENNADKEYLNNEKIKSVNRKLISLAKENNLKYLNPSKALIDENGNLKADATNDGIHVNSDYAKQWAGYLAKITN